MFEAILILVIGSLFVWGAARTFQRVECPSPQDDNMAAARTRLASGADTLEDGALAALTGRVRALDKLLTAPLSGRECVSYRSRVDLWIVDDRGNKKTHVSEVVRTALAPFILETRHGRVLVIGEQVSVTLIARSIVPFDGGRAYEFVRSSGCEDSGVVGDDFFEAVVRPGDTVRVAGVIVVETERAHVREIGYRETTTMIRITNHPRCPLTIGPARPGRSRNSRASAPRPGGR